MNKDYLQKTMNECIVSTLINEMLEREIITEKESVQLAVKIDAKTAQNPSNTPHCEIQTATTK